MEASFLSTEGAGGDFVPRVLIWSTLQGHLMPPEVDEVRRILGAVVIDKNEDLQQEVLALSEILADFRQQNAALRSRIKPRLRGSAAQELLELQIRQFIDKLRSTPDAVSVSKPGDDADGDEDVDMLDRLLTSPREKEVLRLIDGTTRHPSISNQLSHRPPSAASSGCRPLSSRAGRRPSTSAASQSTSASAPEVLEPFRGRLNVYSIDSVAADIRASLAEETQALMDDIEYLQLCLEETADERVEVVAMAARPPEPSVTELRGIESKLQKEVMKRDAALEMSRILSKAPSGPGLASHSSLGIRSATPSLLSATLGSVPPSSPSSHTSSSTSLALSASMSAIHISPKKPAEPPLRAQLPADATPLAGGGLSKFRGTVPAGRPPVFSESDAANTQKLGPFPAILSRPKSRAQRLREEISSTRDDGTG